MLSIRIALRFTLKKWLKMSVILFALTFGVATFYFILNVSSGLESVVYSATANNKNHITVSTSIPYDAKDHDLSLNISNDLKKISTLEIAALSYQNHLLLDPSNTQKAISIIGVDFNKGQHGYNILKRIKNSTIKGDHKVPSDDFNGQIDGEIAIGNNFLSAQKNKKLNSIHLFENPLTKETFRLRIVAIFYSNDLDLGSTMAFTTIETAQKIFNDSKINTIDISLNDPLKSLNAHKEITSILDQYQLDYSIRDWQDGNRYIVNLLYVESTIVLLMQFLTAASISFGIASIFLFTVKEKYMQIGILKTLGMKDSRIGLVFLFQVLILSILGILLGIFFGNMMATLFNHLYTHPNGHPLVPLKTTFFNTYSLSTALVIFMSNVVAAILPMFIANKLEIIEVIKND